MNIKTVMDELGDALDTISGLRVHRFPTDQAEPPSGIVGFPDTYTFDEAYQRGMDKMTIPVSVFVGKVSDRSTPQLLDDFCAGSGERSVKQAIDGYEATAWDVATVSEVEFVPFSINAIDYLAATFLVDVVGSGS